MEIRNMHLLLSQKLLFEEMFDGSVMLRDSFLQQEEGFLAKADRMMDRAPCRTVLEENHYPLQKT